MRILALWLVAIATIFGPAAAATNHPIVSLVITQAIVVVQNGKTVDEPMPSSGAKGGDLIRYTIAAVNKGSAPALDLRPVGKIPKLTTYVMGSANPGEGVTYSLDGSAFSAKPMVDKRDKNGKVTRVAADPATYIALTWHDARPLAVHATQLFTYEVRVK